MARKTDPAVAAYLAEIGRKGGQTTGDKGFRKMNPEAVKELSKRGVEARRKKQAARRGRKSK